MDEPFELLLASLLPGVGPRRVRELAERGPLASVLAAAESHGDLLPEAARRALRSGAAGRRAEEERRRAQGLGIRLVGWHDRAYPALLAATYDPPPVLYVRGVLEEEESAPALAIVGARAASPQGLAFARSLARDLAAAGLTIVSGLARGTDTAAHEGALDAGGRTVAVLGSGLDRLYPEENAALAERIARRGAVVSEFPLGTEPRPAHFPRRNRVIAGWGKAVVVVEASERSGALVTARLGLEEGREVMAVPGHPSHPGSAGTNALLRDGAVLVRGAADVAAELGVRLLLEAEPDDPVLAALARGVPLALDELQDRVRLEVAALLSRLTELEMDGKVRRLPGALFTRA